MDIAMPQVSINCNDNSANFPLHPSAPPAACDGARQPSLSVSEVVHGAGRRLLIVDENWW
jgi:hypothetical protein